MHSISYGTKNLNFSIERSTRKTLAIEVHPDSSIHLKAPEKVSLKDLKSKVDKRARWIVKQQIYFEQFLPATPKRDYVSGETHLYLGKRYNLKVIKGEPKSVKMKQGKIIVASPVTDSETIRLLLAGWYYDHAKQKFNDIAEKAKAGFYLEDISVQDLQIKRMKKRWGSCTPKGKITLNPELIKAPKKCIEYVIIHELCHLVVPAHNNQFFSLLLDKMPDWKRWKMRLEKSMA